MGPPEQITPQKLADYLEALSKAVFQAGISWQVIEAKWEGFRAAFAGFDPETVAAFTDDDVERLMDDPGVVRNRRKIEATVRNAQVMLELDPGVRGLRQLPAFAAGLRGAGRRPARQLQVPRRQRRLLLPLRGRRARAAP